MQAKHQSITHPKYRPDIDGLRAIAIISVVIFHAFRDYFKGGFIGVDIFFVISGFLISTIVFTSLEQNRFSIIEFYVKRIRRIFPALIFTLLISIIFGWFVLFTDEYERFGKHLTGGIGFISNFIFWQESGYFDSTSETKPLLHLWSLAIEEQFYLFWPLLMAFLWKSNIGFLKVISLIAIISFVFNIYLLDNHPEAAFYLPITRVWELIAGGLLSYVMLHHSQLIKNYKNVQSFFGLFLLAIGLLLINEERSFPGWWALLPIFGASFVISAGSNSWLNEKLLSNNLMVSVGKISYPMYLWHWPLLSFAYILGNGNISPTHLIFVLLLTILLSWVTYKFVEQPIRFGKYKFKSTFTLLVMMLSLLIIGFLVNFGIISPRNNNHELEKFIEARNDVVDFPQNFSKFQFGSEEFYRYDGATSETTLFLGDSHTEQYLPRITYVLDKHPTSSNTIYIATQPGCLPIPGIILKNNSIIERSCNSYRDSIFQLINNKNIKSVILGGCWNCYLIKHPEQSKDEIEDDFYARDENKKEALKSLKEFLIHTNKSKTVYLLLDNPVGPQYDPSNYLQGDRLNGFSVNPMPINYSISNDQLKLRTQLIDIANQAHIKIIDPADTLCPHQLCKISNEHGEPLYKDTNHLRASYVRNNASYIDNTIVRKDKR